jgi:hypothetical protein
MADNRITTVVRCGVGAPGSLVGKKYWPNQGRTVPKVISFRFLERCFATEFRIAVPLFPLVIID